MCVCLLEMRASASEIARTALVYFRKLAWIFSAETTAILVIEAIMCVIALKKHHQTYKAYLVLALFPLSILLVWFLENVVGWD